MIALEYSKWSNFVGVIDKAKSACKLSQNNIDDHFTDASKTIQMPKGATKLVDDYKLSRYACYLIAQNGDPRKESIALAQTYFAVQTRKQEILAKDFDNLTDDEKRLIERDITRKENKELNETAKKAGVKNFAKFHNEGYKGLYNGETADDIAKRKGLRYREDILDNMDLDELAANSFRISMTSQKLKNDNINNESDANMTHFNVGKKIRETIAELGGTMPEDLPLPKKSIKEIQKQKKYLK